MTRVRLDIITMAGSEYALWDRDGAPSFPHGELGDGEPVAEAARRIVKAWSGTENPKLELVDVISEKGALSLVLRAMLVDEPKDVTLRAKRMELPKNIGHLASSYVEDALKTSIAYKLTRRA